MKKLIYVAGLAGLGLFFSSCFPAYIETEPSYVEIERPSAPGNDYIWIDGGWVWSRPSHNYVHRSGYWERPRQGRTYVSGQWQSNKKGRYWQSGKWKKEGREGGSHRNR